MPPAFGPVGFTSICIRPDIHAVVREHDENFTRFLNNVFARKYDLPLCPDDRVRKAKRLRRLRETTADLEHEIAALSPELQDDHLGQEIRDEMERQYAKIVAVMDERERAETEAALRVEDIRNALDAIIGTGSLERYKRMLSDNDPHGDHYDEFESLVARVSRRCGAEIDPAEVVQEIRCRVALAHAEVKP